MGIKVFAFNELVEVTCFDICEVYYFDAFTIIQHFTVILHFACSCLYKRVDRSILSV
jgi:hypothetical protein